MNAETGNWCSEIKQVFSILGLNETYNNRGLCDIDNCKENIWNIAQNDWNRQAEAKPKLRTYVTFKDTLDVTDYVKRTMSRFDRSLLAKFRCGILQLHIETGRFNQTKLPDRICNICNTGNIEDEFHFLCICPYYETERNDLYNYIHHKHGDFVRFNDQEKFIFLMKYHNYKVMKYLKLAWQKRKDKLFV